MLTFSFITYGQYMNETQKQTGLDACGINVQAVSPFNLKRYLGFYYEIAVSRALFEAGNQVDFPLCLQETYILQDNQTITVDILGFNSTGGQAGNILIGEPLQDPNIGALQVSLTGGPPFSPYNVIGLRQSILRYRIALVYACFVPPFPGAPPIPFIEILSRRRKISKLQFASLIKIAKDAGLDQQGILDLVINDQTDPICFQ